MEESRPRPFSTDNTMPTLPLIPDPWPLIPILLVSYLLGSLPTGYLVCRWVKEADIRQLGSGNIGATNVVRVLGKKWGGLVLGVDIGKGFLPVFAVMAWWNQPIWALLAGAAAIIGHSKTVWLRFSGGKAVATGAGTVLGLDPLVGAILLGLWVVLVLTTRYVSVASMVAAAALPVLLAAHAQPRSFVVYGLAVAILVIVRHQSNLQRLWQGTEHKVGTPLPH